MLLFVQELEANRRMQRAENTAGSDRVEQLEAMLVSINMTLLISSMISEINS